MGGIPKPLRSLAACKENDVKLGNLKSLGHNISDSVASGIGLMVGTYEMNVFAEAASAAPGHIDVNFLNGEVSGTPASASLRLAIRHYQAALPDLAAKHGIAAQEIATLSTRFGTDPAYGPHFTVTVASHDGRQSTDRYVGTPGRRLHRQQY